MEYPKDYSEKPVDDIYQEAVDVVVKAGYCTASLLQRRFTIGYAKSAHLIDLMEERGVVGPSDYRHNRKVLIKLPSNPNPLI